MVDRCNCCGWLLDEEHFYNVHCAVANAENDQLEAEVAEYVQEEWTEERERLLNQATERALEAALDQIAYGKFLRRLRG